MEYVPSSVTSCEHVKAFMCKLVLNNVYVCRLLSTISSFCFSPCSAEYQTFNVVVFESEMFGIIHERLAFEWADAKRNPPNQIPNLGCGVLIAVNLLAGWLRNHSCL